MKFRVYGKDNCQYCTKAVAFLTQRNFEFQYLKLDEDFTRDELLARFPDAKTFPQIDVIWDNDEESKAIIRRVGGYNELVERFG